MRLASVVATIALAAAFTGCAAPVAKQYYNACLEAGYNEGECKMRAIEVNQRAWQNAGDAMQRFGEGLQRLSPPPPAPSAPARRPDLGDQYIPSRQLYCYPGGGGTMFCQ